MAFWHLYFFHSKYLLAPLKAGLISNPVPASPASTAGGGDSPSYSGFFHCLAVFDDRSSPCSTQAAVYHVRVFYPVLLLVHLVQPSFACVLDLETFLDLFHAQVHICSILNMTKSPSLDKINYPGVFISWIPFCLFTGVSIDSC